MGGGSRRGNNYTLDGVPITDLLNRPVAHPTIEALEDLKVQVHTYDAEMGRTGGGVFNATLRSGTNNYHGTTFFQTRPVWSQVNNYFAQKAFDVAGDPRNAKPDTAYYMAGGGFGGPIVKNKTFFFFSGENYHDLSTILCLGAVADCGGTRGRLLRADELERSDGDDLRPADASGVPGEHHPGEPDQCRAAAITKYLPLPQSDRDNGSPNFTVAAPVNNYFQQQYAVKVEHKFAEKVSLTGFYLYNRTDEPVSPYFEPGLNARTALPIRATACWRGGHKSSRSITRGSRAIARRCRCGSGGHSLSTLSHRRPASIPRRSASPRPS